MNTKRPIAALPDVFEVLDWLTSLQNSSIFNQACRRQDWEKIAPPPTPQDVSLCGIVYTIDLVSLRTIFPKYRSWHC